MRGGERPGARAVFNTGRISMNTRALKKELKYRIPQLKLILIREPNVKGDYAILTPTDIEQFAEPLKYMPEEHFVAFHLDARLHIIGFNMVSHGTISASLVHPREVFKAALLSNADSIIVAHNHPAGSLRASGEDVQTTIQLLNAGQMLGVPVLDHIIVARGGIASIREEYPELWKPPVVSD